MEARNLYTTVCSILVAVCMLSLQSFAQTLCDPPIDLGDVQVFVCNEASYTIPGPSGYTNYIWTSTELSEAVNTQNLTVTQTGKYNLEVYDAVNDCYSYDFVEVAFTTVDLPDPEPISACAGDVVNITGPSIVQPTSYYWTNASGNVISNGQNISITQSGTYNYHAVNFKNCQDVASYVVNIHANPVLNIADAVVCADDMPYTIDAPSGYASYLWSNGATSEDIIVSDAGDYVLTVIDENGCTATTSVNIEVVSLPSINFTDAVICEGDAGVTFTAPAGYVSYSWSNGANTQSITTSNAGTYTVTVFDANGCSTSGSATLTVNPNPQFSLDNVSICEAAAPAVVDGPAGYASYLWSNGSTSEDLTTSTSGTYSLTVTDANGCSATAMATVTINDEPTINLQNITLCSDDAPAVVNGPAGYASYLWSTGATTQNIAVFESGVYVLTVIDDNGCEATGTSTVTINQNPEFNLEHVTICAGDAPAVVDGPAGFASYQWSNGATTEDLTTNTSGTYTLTVTDAAGCSASDVVNVFINDEPSFTLADITTCAEAGTVTIPGPSGFTSYLWSNGATTQNTQVTQSGVYVLTVVDANGCEATATSTVTINQANTFDLADYTVCDGITSITIDGPAGYASYLWSNGATTEDITVSAAGTYTLTATDFNGCEVSGSSTVTINTSPSISLNDVEVCSDLLPAMIDGPAGYASYLWSNGATTENITVTQSGIYTLTVTDANGCTGTASAMVTINQTPSFDMPDVSTCTAALPYTLTAPSGYVSYSWSTGASSQSITVSSAGTYTVTVVDANGCVTSDDVTIDVTGGEFDLGDQIIVCNQASYVIDGPSGFQTYQWISTQLPGPIYSEDLTVHQSGKYTLVVNEGTPCEYIDFVNIIFTYVDIPDPAPIVVCEGETVNLTGPSIELGTSYYWTNEAGVTIANGQNLTVTESGDYTYHATNFKNCSDEATYSVTVNPTPVVEVNDVEVCQNSLPATLTATGGFVSYQWSNGGFGQSINVYTPGVYSVTVTDVNGCVGTTTAVVTVNQNPTISLQNVTVCDDQTPATIFGPSGFASYQWSNGDVSQNLVTSQAGTYTLTVTDANGCTASASATVTINQSPSITLNDVTVCEDNLPVTLTAPFGFQSYIWSNGSNSQSITVFQAGTYTVTAVDFNGCDASASATVTVNPQPQFSLQNVTICQEDAPATVQGPAGYASYQWSNGQGSQMGTFYQSGIYTLTVTDNNGCSGTASVMVTINPEPSFTLQDVEVCDYQTPVTVDGPFGYASYLWSNGATTQNIQVSQSGVYTLTAIDFNGCDATASAVVTINQAPTVDLDDVTVCNNGQPVVLTAPSGFASYFWSTGSTQQSIQVFNSGVYSLTVTDANGCQASTSALVTINNNPSINLQDYEVCAAQAPVTVVGPAGFASYQWSNGANTQNITVNQSGVYTLTVTDMNGCTATASSSVGINAQPSITLQDVTVCQDGLPAVVQGPSGFVSYQWSNGAQSQNISVYQSGIYTLTVIDANGCTATASAVVTVNAANPFTLQNVTICAEDQPAVVQGPAGYASYQWSNGQQTQNLTTSQSGIYTLTVTDVSGCTASASVTVTINPEPSFSLQDVEVCSYDAPVTLFGPAGYINYQWNNGAFTQNIQVSQSGEYCLTVVNSNGCDATACATVIVNQAPNIELADITVCDDQAPVTIQGPAGFASYQWSNGAQSQNITVNASGVYTLTVTDSNGCQDTATSLVTINQSPEFDLPDVEVCADNAPVTLFGPAGFVNYQWSNGAFTQNIQVSQSGVYTLTVTDANGCTGTAVSVVTINAEPNANIDDVVVCSDDLPAVVFGPAGFASYQWSNGAQSQNITVYQAGVYTVTYTDNNGCSGTTSATVTINPEPTFNLADITVCEDDVPVTLDGPAGYASYEWSTGANSEDLVTSTPGVYFLTVTDANGCSTTEAATVSILQNPVIDLDDHTVCESELPFMLTGPVGFVTYNWSNGATTQNIFVTEAGTYCVTVTDNKGCTDTACSTITVNGLPVFELDDVTICEDNAPAVVTAPAGFESYVWSNGETDPILSTSIPGVYELTVSDANGCSYTTQFVVAINQNPIFDLNDIEVCNMANIGTIYGPINYVNYMWVDGNGNVVGSDKNYNPTAAGTYCLTVTDANGCQSTECATVVIGNDINFDLQDVTLCDDQTPAVLTGPAGFSSYFWSNGANSQTITVYSSGVYSLTVSDGQGCTATADAIVTINQSPVIDLQDVSICAEDGSAVLSAPAGYTSYLWSTGATTSSIAVTASGIYSVTVTDANGCDGSASATVTINNAATFTLEDVSICDGSMATVFAPGGYVSYNWMNASGVTVSTGSSLQTTTTGTYTVSVIDNNGCSFSTSVNISIADDIVFDLNDATICDGQTTTLMAPAGFTSYLWSNGATSQNIVVATAGTYCVTVMDANGCSGEACATVTVNTPPSVNLDDVVVCEESLPVTLTASSQCVAVEWSTGATTTSISATTAGTYSYVCFDANGCSATATGEVIVDTAGSIDNLLSDIDACFGDAVLLEGPAGYATYSWTCNGTEISTDQSILVSEACTYVLNVTTAEGCSATGDAIVTFTDEIIAEVSIDCDTQSGQASVVVVVTQGVDDDGNYLISLNGIPQGSFPGFYVTNVESGQLSVEITDATGCSVTYDVTVPDCAKVEDGKVGDTVFFDDNANGVQDEGEVGIANVTVYLIDGDGNIIDETVTDENGMYMFGDLAYDNYSVQVDVTDVPGYSLTTAGLINVPVDENEPINLVGDFGFVICSFGVAQTSITCQNAEGYVTVLFNISNDPTDSFEITGVDGGTFVSYEPAGGGAGILTIDVDLDAEFLGNYTIYFNGPCGPGELGSSVSCQSVTAVELLEFDGRAEGEDNYLFWTTATEYETDYFVLERSADGVNFEQAALINAIGFSSTEVSYSHLDTDVEAGKTYFYRLAEVTTDGTMEYVSDIVEITRNANFTINHVYPTVATNNVAIDVVSPVETTLTIMVFATDGKLMDVQTNTVVGESTINLNVNSYTAGTYFVRVNDGTAVESAKFIKN